MKHTTCPQCTPPTATDPTPLQCLKCLYHDLLRNLALFFTGAAVCLFAVIILTPALGAAILVCTVVALALIVAFTRSNIALQNRRREAIRP